MFQRLSNMLFGAVEEVSAEINGPKPCVTEADEEGWLLVSVPGNTDCTMLGEDGAEVPSVAQSLPCSENLSVESECNKGSPAPHTRDSAPYPCKRRRTRAGRSRTAPVPSPRSFSSPLSFESPALLGSVGGNVPLGPAPCPRASAVGLDESWFITPPPCFTAEGAPAEASPMEDLLIEHPSMSVYVSSSNLEPSSANVEDGVSRMSESVPAPVPTRLVRGSACQVVPLAKMTQMSRVQRAKARTERRHMARGRMQRQNRVRQQVPRHAVRSHNTFLHQPSQRGFCH